MPTTTVGYLQKPDAAVLLKFKIYKMLVEPLILPLVAHDNNVWMYVARRLSYVLGVLQNILKFTMQMLFKTSVNFLLHRCLTIQIMREQPKGQGQVVKVAC